MNESFLDLTLEELEDRRMLAGNVTVEITGNGDIRVMGDNSDNSITLNIASDVRVVGNDGSTTVNGQQAGQLVILDPGNQDLRDLVVSMKGGNDDVLVQGGFDLRNGSFNLGSGNDTTRFAPIAASQFSGNLRISLGSGDSGLGSSSAVDGEDQHILIGNTTVDRNLTIRGGSTHDRVEIQDSAAYGAARVSTGGGEDHLQLFASGGRTRVATGGGNDLVQLASTTIISDDLTIRLGGGDDEAQSVFPEVNGDYRIVGGGGTDSTLSLGFDLPDLVGVEITN